MKMCIRYFLFLLSSAWFLQSAAQDELNVMTFNLRYDNPADSLNGWVYRKDKVCSQVRFHDVQLLGVQEGLQNQLADLLDCLPQMKFTGVGRADGKTKGEYSAIFYDTTRLVLWESKTFWLSEHPEQPGSKGWDAAIERIVTWAKFKDRKTGKVFYHFNTHFDHMGKIARRESARLLLQKIGEIAANTPTLVTGDLNAIPDDEPVRVLTDTTITGYLKDTKYLSRMPHYGPTGTFNGFTGKEKSDEPIDYIFIKGKIEVLKHATLSQSWQGRFPSDHFPVLAVVKME